MTTGNQRGCPDDPKIGIAADDDGADISADIDGAVVRIRQAVPTAWVIHLEPDIYRRKPATAAPHVPACPRGTLAASAPPRPGTYLDSVGALGRVGRSPPGVGWCWPIRWRCPARPGEEDTGGRGRL